MGLILGVLGFLKRSAANCASTPNKLNDGEDLARWLAVLPGML